VKQRGFSLAEIAIVLVIIGLLLGGVLKAQEMVTQTKIKRVIADLTGVSAAVYHYVDRYGMLPGDDRDAARWSGAAAGNGNGAIEGGYASPTVTDESRRFWDHLRRAGFVSGSGTDNPLNSVMGKIGVQTGDGNGGGVLGAAPGVGLINTHILCSANLPDRVAAAVDLQMDDGRGTSGSVRAKKGAPNPTLVADQAADDYTEDGVTIYLVCRQM
jgi:prepilin-type N-terminal cleavage/methylation domain-containing protein